MAVPRFYHPELAEGRTALSASESAHARQARRLRVGDEVVLFDGAGRWASGVVADCPAKGPVSVMAGRVDSAPAEKPRIVLLTAIPKGPRQDYLIEKCTELGVNVIQPVVFERGVVRPREAKVEKWRRTATEAAKQCRRLWLPVIEPPSSFDQAITDVTRAEAAWYGDYSDRAQTLIKRLEEVKPVKSVSVVVGPEGGFTSGEIGAMEKAGFRPVILGPHVLRTETAAAAATALISAWRASGRDLRT